MCAIPSGGQLAVLEERTRRNWDSEFPACVSFFPVTLQVKLEKGGPKFGCSELRGELPYTAWPSTHQYRPTPPGIRPPANGSAVLCFGPVYLFYF